MLSKRRNALFFTLLPLAVLLMVAVAIVEPLPAQAATSTGSSQPHILGIKGYEPASQGQGSSKNMVYHGGPIMANTSADYIIFWQPTGSKVSKTFNSLILRYFGDVGASALYHNNTQYTDSHGNKPTGAVLGGSWVDTQAYPSNYITDKQLQAEVTHAMQMNGWTASLQHVFFIYTVQGAHICFNNSHKSCSPGAFCAYHSNFGNVIYAAMPDVGICGTPTSPNHNPVADSTIDSTSHEQNEAASDPLGNAWYNPSGNEIGDLCSTSYGPLNKDGSDVVWNGHPYIVQEEWSNAQSKCVIAGP